MLVPYLMWVKMSASVGVVVVIFLSTNYRMAQVGTQLVLHMALMAVHAVCFHVVHQYDTQVRLPLIVIIMTLLAMLNTVVKSVIVSSCLIIFKTKDSGIYGCNIS